MSKKLETSKEQAQMHTPPTQGNVGEPPILYTPLNEERNKRRDREVATLASGPSEQSGVKRHRLNPLSKEKFFEETSDSQRKEGVDSHQTFPVGGTSTTSQKQKLKRQQSAKVSSFRPPGKDILDIKKKFIEIKSRNDPLRL